VKNLKVLFYFCQSDVLKVLAARQECLVRMRCGKINVLLNAYVIQAFIIVK
jgi:hypothetical protein